MTTTFLGLVLMYSGTEYAVWIWVTAATPFYFATWEEYHLGRLDLPVINGVSDGCFLIGLVIFGTGLTGPEFWSTPVLLDYEPREMAFVFFVISALLTVFGNLYSVAIKTKRPYGLQSCSPYLCIVATILFVRVLSPSSITINNHVLLLAFLGFIFAKDCALLQFGHVTELKYSRSRIS
jgi:ethanolaminephosphotransferase